MQISKALVVKICEKLGTELINFKILRSGAFNINYMLITTRGNFVVRINSKNRLEEIFSEYKILKKLKGVFGPKVYIFDDSKTILTENYLVEEFLEGNNPVGCSDEFLKLMGDYYARLHQNTSSKIPIYTRAESHYTLTKAFGWSAEYYYQFMHLLTSNLLVILDPLYKQAGELIDKHEDLFKKRTSFSITQGDPSRMNIIINKNSVKLIDWEFAKYDLREWDLVFFIWAFDLSQVQKLYFLKHASYPTTPESLFSLEMIYLLHCLMILSWKVKRLTQIRRGEIDKSQMSSNEKEVILSIHEDVALIEKSLQKLQ